ncbi:DUF4864 domain-containing protein [Gymnodinialimonas sp.]
MIRAAVLSFALAFAALLPASAQEMLDPNPEIEAVIGSQINAFRAEDVLDAWQYASPNIQGMFGDPQNFGRMVEQGYPMVWNPAEVDFIDLQTFGAVIVQRVEVVDQAGNLHYLGYAMIETEDGWRINGVQVLRAPALGA